MKFKIWHNSLFLSIGLILVAKLLNSNFKGFHRILALRDPLSSDSIVSQSMKELVVWAKGSSYPMFVVPPEDKVFDSFRYFSKKSLWGRVPDINQLAYSPDFYLKGMDRLLTLGFSATAKHAFEFQYNLCYLGQKDEFNNLPIVIRNTDQKCLSTFNILFKNSEFLVVGKK